MAKNGKGRKLETQLGLDEARDLARTCLKTNGCDEANATAAANRMIDAERDGCSAHGLFRLPWYVAALKSGRANGSARPIIAQLAPAVLRVDGQNGFAPLAQTAGHQPLTACARTNGIAALAITNIFHIAALWPEVEKLAEDGLCAIACTPSYPYVAPAGGIRPLFGTNPIAFAWPRPDGPPLVFDQASSALARGEIQIAARDGKSVPQTAGIGPAGETTTDPNVILEGAQLAFGGYKGASLAMMVELLAGPLIGQHLSFEALNEDAGKGAPPKGGELILALDPSKFGDADGFLAHGEKLFAQILTQDGTRLPGARRQANRSKITASGFAIPRSLHETILQLM